MLFGRVDFDVNDVTYTLWAWKGDYWNYYSGAEVGLYVFDGEYSGIPHYDAVRFEVPMTLSLYSVAGNSINSVYNWVPYEDQWWITGFNPTEYLPDPNSLVSVASVDLSNHPSLYAAISNSDEAKFNNDGYLNKDHLIFDDETQTVWIQWYN